MLYQIQFIRFVDRRPEPEILQETADEFPSLADAKARGRTLFATIQAATGAQGFRIRENGHDVVSHWFPGTD